MVPWQITQAKGLFPPLRHGFSWNIQRRSILGRKNEKKIFFSWKIFRPFFGLRHFFRPGVTCWHVFGHNFCSNWATKKIKCALESEWRALQFVFLSWVSRLRYWPPNLPLYVLEALFTENPRDFGQKFFFAKKPQICSFYVYNKNLYFFGLNMFFFHPKSLKIWIFHLFI